LLYRNMAHIVVNLVDNIAVTENLFTLDSWTEFIHRYKYNLLADCITRFSILGILRFFL
jgi:hypothetical protein